VSERKRRPESVKNWNTEYYQLNCEKLKAYQRAYQAANREKISAQMKQWRLNRTPEQKELERHKKRIAAYKRRYGITLEQYEAMMQKQNEVCAICQVPGATGSYGMLDVDHCHKTGKVRGLLCIKCNHAIGVLGDDVEGLMRAIKYLKNE
jgi:hypothetical protein